MRTQDMRSWVLLTGFAAGVALATAHAFAVEPHALMRRGVQPREIDHSTYLIELLEGSWQFRVRAQAAISLGIAENALAARGALTAALRDGHPAVRAVAAASLGRMGDANDVGALRMLEADTEEPVRRAARASIGRLERTIAEPPAVLDTTATTAALSVATTANRL